MSNFDYRINYTIERSEPGKADYVEVGFGSTGIWSSPEQAAHMLQADVDHRVWETTDGMPEPDDA